MNSREIIKLLKRHGWVHVRTVGDHYHFKHPEKQNLVTVTHPRKDFPIGTLKRIEKDTGLKLR